MTKYLLLLSLFCIGCECDSNKLPAPPEYKLEYKNMTLRVIEIDKCEYISNSGSFYSNSAFLTHKGNCKYCEQRRKNNH